jgi:hypothetical protein
VSEGIQDEGRFAMATALTDEPNLLAVLHRWANQQDENFTTDAFAYLLRHLRDHEPNALVHKLDKLTGGWPGLDTDSCRSLEIGTQETITEGRLDIVIKGPADSVVVEVKVEQEIDVEQLKRYRKHLDTGPVNLRKRLILLTRYPIEDHAIHALVDVEVRWYQIAEWLEASLPLGDPVNAYLVRQFLGFLRKGGMTMERVGWELTRGVQSLRHLFDMLNEALISCGMTIRMTKGGIGVGGHYFSVHSTECWAGLYHAEKPDVVVFEAYDIAKKAAPAVSIGHFKEQGKNTVKWANELELSSESVHFFALSKERQQESLERFLRDCIETVRKIRGAQAQTVAS